MTGYPTTYAGWIAKIKSWLATADLSDDIFGEFLTHANSRLNRDLNSQFTEATEVVPWDPDGIDIATELPDYNRMRLVRLLNQAPLKGLSVNEFYDKIAEEPDESSAVPLFYCVDAMKLHIWPAPAENTDVYVHYYIRVAPLSGSVATNAFSVNHPDAFFYAALLESAPFLVEDERLEMWANLYDSLKVGYNVVADRATKGATPLQRIIKVM